MAFAATPAPNVNKMVAMSRNINTIITQLYRTYFPGKAISDIAKTNLNE
jgi:hypothetical protein